LAFARKQAAAPKILDLNKTIESMLAMLRRLIGEDIDLLWLPGKGLGLIKMDPSQIDQILANLCANSRDSIGNIGKITIETANIVADETFCAGHTDIGPGKYVQLTFSDNGSGMEPEVLSHLFEPFFTTKNLGEGTGLGLAMIYGIIKQNHGAISVDSKPGLGTTFRIYLPQYEAQVDSAQTDSNIAKEAGCGTILLVEDEPMILEMTTLLLKRLGYNILPAATPAEAIRLAEEHVGEIQMLMTDVIMPAMNGRDLARKLSSLHPKIKRLFMSGYTANVIAQHGVLEEGMNFIQKPFSIKELSAKVREVLA
jgi:CheY-like chemotaxis protein